MRQYWYRHCITGLTTILCLTAGITHAQQRETQPIAVQQRGSNIYEVTGGSGANTGFYIGDDVVVVIDTKMDEQSNTAILDHISTLTNKPIAYIINTHSDGDHVNGNPYYPQDAVIVAHDGCRAEILLPGRDGSPSTWNTPERMTSVPELTYQDRMILHLGSHNIELWHFGTGHTTGDTVVYFPGQKVAFIGDQIFLERPQLIHAYKDGNSFGHVDNLTAMLETLDAELFLSGHNPPVNRQQVSEHIAAMQARQEKVSTLMGKKMTLDQIKAEFEENEGTLVEVIYNELGE